MDELIIQQAQAYYMFVTWLGITLLNPKETFCVASRQTYELKEMYELNLQGTSLQSTYVQTIQGLEQTTLHILYTTKFSSQDCMDKLFTITIQHNQLCLHFKRQTLLTTN